MDQKGWGSVSQMKQRLKCRIFYSKESTCSKTKREKSGLKLNIQKAKIMASCPITSWQIEGEKEETVTDFLFLSIKITTEGDCSHEIKRHLLLGEKAITNLDSV